MRINAASMMRRRLNPQFTLLLPFRYVPFLACHFGDVFAYGLHDKSDIKDISHQSDQ
jgi:hypothetical protein